MNSSSIYTTLLKTFTLAVNNKKEIDNVMNELNLIKNIILEYNDISPEIKNKLNNIEYTLNNQQEEIYKINNINLKQTTDITLLNKTLKELSNQINNLNKNISDNTNNIDNINTIINDLDVESITELSQNINTVINTLSTTVGELTSHIQLE